MTKMTAKKYLAAGFVVFPVGLTYNEEKSANGKVKKDVAPEPGFTKLTLQAAKKLSFTKNAIGLLTGFGVMALDIDNVNLWNHILSELGETEPETCKSISQSGGRHLLFKVTPELERLRKKSVFGLKALGRDDFDVLGKGDFLLVPPSSFLTPLEKREYTFVEGYSLLNNPEKLIEAPEWLLQVLTPGSVPHNRVRGTFLRQDLAKKAAEKKERERVEKEDQEQEVKEEQEEEEQDHGGDDLTENERALLDLDLKDRLKEVAKHIKKLRADRAVDRQSWIEVGMAIHHATDGQGMELWDEFSRRAGPYDRRTLEYQWDSFKNGSGITIGSLIHWAKEDAKKKTEERKEKKALEEKTKTNDDLRREAVKFGVDHTGGKGVFDSWDENLVAVIKNTMHHPDHRVRCVFGPDGAFQQCLECAWRNPFAGQLMIPKTEYPVLHQQFINITINNTVNHYNDNTSNDISWCEFQVDKVNILDDPGTNTLLLGALSGTNTRVAKLFDRLHGSCFAFCDETWFFFDHSKGLWVIDGSQINLRDLLMSDDFLSLFGMAKLAFEASKDITKKDKKLKTIQCTIEKMEMAGYKAGVITELATIVGKRSPNFVEKLDKNRSLLAFENGVYDLDADVFRKGQPNDMLSISTGYDHVPGCIEHQDRINDFLCKVFPDPSVREYTLRYLASCLAGYTRNQLAFFGFGGGANGKSVLLSLMKETLGNYASSMKREMITGKSNPDPNAATPSLMALVGKRFVYVSESIDGSAINESTFKTYSGGDMVPGRGLYKSNKEVRPDFKLFFVCNHLPKFNASDDAMVRRIKVIPFVSTFVDRHHRPELPEQHVYHGDPSLGEEVFKTWRATFMNMLLDCYRRYKTDDLGPTPAGLRSG